MKRAFAAALVLTLGAGLPAYANMTIAAQAAGGLIPVRTEAIVIDEEELFISPEKVRVHYVFRNVSGKDIQAPILFPLPDLDTRLQSAHTYIIPISYNAPPPVVPARVKINGEDVGVGWQQHAHTAEGRDVTDRLKVANLPLMAFGNYYEALGQLSDSERRALMDEEIIDQNYQPNWILRGAYRWEQFFPANGTTVVDLEYQPLTGGYERKVPITETPSAIEKSLTMRAARLEFVPWHEEYCVTKENIEAMGQLPSIEDEGAVIRWTRYVLVTARNWRGSIGRFRLVVDKLKSDAVAAFCSPDGKAPIRQIGPTTYEVLIKDFRPANNFQLLTISPE